VRLLEIWTRNAWKPQAHQEAALTTMMRSRRRRRMRLLAVRACGCCYRCHRCCRCRCCRRRSWRSPFPSPRRGRRPELQRPNTPWGESTFSWWLWWRWWWSLSCCRSLWTRLWACWFAVVSGRSISTTTKWKKLLLWKCA